MSSLTFTSSAIKIFADDLLSLLDTDNNNSQVWLKNPNLLSAGNSNIQVSGEAEEIFDCLKSKTDIPNIKKICEEINKLLIGKKIRMFYLLRGYDQFQVIFYKCNNLDFFCQFIIKNFSKISDFSFDTFIVNASRFEELKTSKSFNPEIFEDIKRNSIGYTEPQIVSTALVSSLAATNVIIQNGISSRSGTPVVSSPNVFSSRSNTPSFDENRPKYATVLNNGILDSKIILKQENEPLNEKVSEKVAVKEIHKAFINSLTISLSCEINQKVENVIFSDGKFCIKKVSQDHQEKLPKMMSLIKEIYPGLEGNPDLVTLIEDLHNDVISLYETFVEIPENEMHNLKAVIIKDGMSIYEDCFKSKGNYFFLFGENQDRIFVKDCEII